MELPLSCHSNLAPLPPFLTEPPVPRSLTTGTLSKHIRHSLMSTTEPTNHSINCYYPQLNKCMSVTSITVMPDMVKPPPARFWDIFIQPTPTSLQLIYKAMTPGCAPCTIKITRSETYSTSSRLSSSTKQQGILPITTSK